MKKIFFTLIGSIILSNVAFSQFQKEIPQSTLFYEFISGVGGDIGVEDTLYVGFDTDWNFIIGPDGEIKKYGGALPPLGYILTGNGSGATFQNPAAAGFGSVTTVSVGNFSPLFLSSVTNPTTTPSITFSPISQSANLVYASPNGVAGTPSFRSITGADLGGFNQYQVVYGGSGGSLTQSPNFKYGDGGNALVLSGTFPSLLVQNGLLSTTITNEGVFTADGTGVATELTPSYLSWSDNEGGRIGLYKTDDNTGTSYDLFLPAQPPALNQVMKSDASGNLTWASVGAGTVSSFSSGNLSPLFTTSVTNPTTTPALSFTLSNAAANTWFGNNTGGAATPSYNSAGTVTRTNDANVTMTLGGTPTNSVLNSFSMTLGWVGQLALSRGGTNADLSATGGTGQYLKQTTAGASISVGTIPASDIASGAALTKVDDTNVTLTLGGSPSTALLAASSLTLGWAGTLATSRGGWGGAASVTSPLQLSSGTLSLPITDQQIVFGSGGTTVTSSSDFTYDNSDGTFAVNNTNTENYNFNLTDKTGRCELVITGTNSKSIFGGRYFNGTFASKTGALNGDILAEFAGLGYKTTGFSPGASAGMQIVAGENFNDTQTGTYLQWFVSATGGTTTQTKLRLGTDGFLRVNNSTAASFPLDVTGDINISTGSVYRINGVQLSTSSVTEGSNLYYTDERAQDGIGVMINASLNYVDATPSLSIADRDWGDITSTGSGLIWTIDNGAVTNIKLANSTISGIALGSNLANLTNADATLTFSGAYNGSTARTIGINLANSNTWTADQIVPAEVYGVAWDASNEVPTKNDVYDKIQSLSNAGLNFQQVYGVTLFNF